MCSTFFRRDQCTDISPEHEKKYKRIIGIAEFKGGLLMKITLYLPITPPLYHVTHTKFIWLSREHSIDTYDLCECVRSL